MRAVFIWLTFLVLVVFAQDDEQGYIVGQISFRGNEAFERDRLLEQMQLKPAGLFRKAPYSFTLLIEDIASLEAYYRNRGYLSVQVSIQNIERNREKKRVSITLKIDEGFQTLLDRVVFKNGAVFSEKQLREIVDISKGEPLDSFVYAKAQSAMVDSLAARGYLFGAIEIKIDLDSGGHFAELKFFIDEGPLVVAGDLKIQGLFKVDSQVIIRELVFRPGDTLNSYKVNHSVRRILRTNLFNRVFIEPLDTTIALLRQQAVKVPVLIQVQETDMFAIQVDAGYDTYNEFYLSAELAYKNLFRIGHRVALLGIVSSPKIGAQLTYNYPWVFSVPMFADFNGYIEKRSEESFSGLFRGVQAQLNGKITLYNFYRIWSRLENVVWLDQAPPTQDFPQLSHKNTVLFGAGLTRDTRVSSLEPGNATFTFLETELAGAGINWSNKFYKVRIDYRHYFSLLNDRLTLASAIFSGYVNSYGDNPVVPPTELFRVGEQLVRPVRGLGEEAVSSVDENGELRGGRLALLLNVVDFTFPIYSFIRGGTFMDAGYVWPTLHSFAFKDVAWSAGLGLMASSTLAIIRLDYGFPLRNLDFLNGRFHLALGLPF